LGVRVIAEICGSGVLALALGRDALRADAVFAAARLDEEFQAERWGVDVEAAARARALRIDFDAAAAFIRLLRS
jgi:chaperone required for assembly of F1-ATPase